MSFVFNTALGRTRELLARVADGGDERLVVLALYKLGLEPVATIRKHPTMKALLDSTSNEATNPGYSRLWLSSADIAPPTVAGDTLVGAITAKLEWLVVDATGGPWGAVLVGYAPFGQSTADADIVPLSYHDVDLTPDGNSIELVFQGGAGVFVTSESP